MVRVMHTPYSSYPELQPGYQYAVFWVADATNASIRHASVSRRNLKTSSAWETFTLPDYNQTDDDGHDVSVNAFYLYSALLLTFA